MNLTTAKIALCFGMMLPAVGAGREPVAWLYNGVRLPGLPEWDKAKYPYAVISKPPLSTSYQLKCYMEGADYYTGETGNWYFGKGALVFIGSADRAEWTESGFNSDANTVISNSIWANFDLLNEDGTVYLSASPPIPVYK